MIMMGSKRDKEVDLREHGKGTEKNHHGLLQLFSFSTLVISRTIQVLVYINILHK